MKKKILILVAMISLLNGLYADGKIFEIGDNISKYFKKHKPMYEVNEKAVFGVEGFKPIDMKDSWFSFLSTKKKNNRNDTFLIVSNKCLIGVMQTKDGHPEFLYDLDNDGILDVSLPKVIMPAYVLSASKYTKKTSNNNVKQYLDQLYDLFNGEKNPYKENRLRNLIEHLLELVKDTNTENRDVIYSIYFFYGMVSKNPYLDMTNLMVSDLMYRKRFNDGVHPIYDLHFLETLINMKKMDKALEVIKSLEKVHPDFVPIQVYSWQYEKNKKKKAQKYKELKKKYPKHWIVKQI